MNLKNIYNMILFKPVFECTPDQLIKMLKIRNELNIRNNMFNSKLIQLDEHIAWSKKIKFDKKDFYFAVIKNKKIIGGLGFKYFDDSKSFDWSFHISSEETTPGIGAVLEYKSLEFIFTKYKPKILNCYVLKTNKKVSNLHKKFGFSETNITRDFKYNYNNIENVLKLCITKDEWELKKTVIKNKFFTDEKK